MQFGYGLAYGLQEIGRGGEVMVNTMRNDLGIRFRREAVAQALELRAQGLVIFDDAVVDNRDLAARNVRVSVFRGGHSMSSPAGMSDAYRSVDRLRIQCILQDLDLSDRAQPGQPPMVEDRDPSGVVAAVLEAAQALHQDWNRATLRDHTHDSTHIALGPS